MEKRGIEGPKRVEFNPGGEGVELAIARRSSGLGPAFVQQCITEKDALAAQYRDAIPKNAQLWLLLVAGTSFSNGVEVPSTTFPFDTRFDRVFFLDCWRELDDGREQERVVELTTRQLQSGGATRGMRP